MVAVGPDSLPAAVRSAACAFGIPPGDVAPLDGASGQTWRAGTHVLRVRPRDRLRVELAAIDAGRSAVPTPRVLATADVGTDSAVLFEHVAGRPAGDLTGLSVDQAFERGRRCGRMHALLASVSAPDTIPVVDAVDTDGAPAAGPLRLLASRPAPVQRAHRTR